MCERVLEKLARLLNKDLQQARWLVTSIPMDKQRNCSGMLIGHYYMRYRCKWCNDKWVLSTGQMINYSGDLKITMAYCLCLFQLHSYCVQKNHMLCFWLKLNIMKNSQNFGKLYKTENILTGYCLNNLSKKINYDQISFRGKIININ